MGLILWRRLRLVASTRRRKQLFRATYQPGRPKPALPGAGDGRSGRRLFGADRGPGREPELLDPATDAAKVRAIFVHPDYARMGLGSLILAMWKRRRAGGGVCALYEMGSTLTGVPLLPAERLCGGQPRSGWAGEPLWNGEASWPARWCKMVKGPDHAAGSQPAVRQRPISAKSRLARETMRRWCSSRARVTAWKAMPASEAMRQAGGAHQALPRR
jgi:GNAT superfamily N-acetyltransferase